MTSALLSYATSKQFHAAFVWHRLQQGSRNLFKWICCRAPGVLDAGPSVEILAEYPLTPEEQQAQDGRESVAVAVRDKHLLATAFHPELTSDLRW